MSKQDTVEEPVEIIEEAPELPTFDLLSLPAVASSPAISGSGKPASGVPASGPLGSGIKRVGTPVKTPARPAPAPAAAPVSPVVWLAAGVGITLGLVAFAVLDDSAANARIIRHSTLGHVADEPPQPSSMPQAPSNPPPAKRSPSAGQNNQSQGKQAASVGQKNHRPNGTTKNQTGNRKTESTTPERQSWQPGVSTNAKPNEKTNLIQSAARRWRAHNLIEARSRSDQGSGSMMAIGDTDDDLLLPMADGPGTSVMPVDAPDASNKTQEFAISTVDGIGADSTVRKRSAGLALGTKLNLAVQMKQDEELQHIYLRFDLERLPTDRKEVRDAIVRMHMMNSSDADGLKLRLHGTNVAAAEK